MSDRKQSNTPNTISDEKWARLREKARKADPSGDSLTDPKAIKRRKQASQQYKNRGWS